MSHRCLATELQQFPALRRSMDEVIGQFLRDGLKPAENMIKHIIGMEVTLLLLSPC
jgi:dynamin 1-like protein